MFYIPQPEDPRSLEARNAWKKETDPVRRQMRRENPYWTIWAETEGEDVLSKQRDDLLDDAMGATEPGREKSASAADVALVEQSRAKGQQFRTDARPKSMNLSSQNQSGGDDHEFLDSPEDWNSQRKL